MNRSFFTRLLGVAAVAVALMVGLFAGGANAQIARSSPGSNISVDVPLGGAKSAAPADAAQGEIGAAQSIRCGYNWGPHTGYEDLYNHCGNGNVWVAIEIDWGWSDWVWTCVSPSRYDTYTNLNKRVPGKNVTYAKSYGQAC